MLYMPNTSAEQGVRPRTPAGQGNLTEEGHLVAARNRLGVGRGDHQEEERIVAAADHSPAEGGRRNHPAEEGHRSHPEGDDHQRFPAHPEYRTTGRWLQE